MNMTINGNDNWVRGNKFEQSFNYFDNFANHHLILDVLFSPESFTAVFWKEVNFQEVRMYMRSKRLLKV